MLGDPNHGIFHPIVKPFDKAGRSSDDYEWLKELCEYLGLNYEAAADLLEDGNSEDPWRELAYRYLADGPGPIDLNLNRMLTKMRHALFLLGCVMRGY